MMTESRGLVVTLLSTSDSDTIIRMTVEQLREVHSARPFRPFILHLADGRRYEVNHPEFLAQSRTGRVLHFVTPKDTIEHIDLLMVVSIEQLPGRGNGSRRRAG